MVTNGDFATDLSGWNNGNSYWQWSSQGAYHPLGSVNNGFNQSFTNQSNKLTFSVEIISGVLAVEFGGVYTFNKSGVYTIYGTTGVVNFKRSGSVECYIDNVSVKEDLSGDFDFSRNSAATRVNAQGLVENVQILSGDLVSNGDFSQEGVQEVSNGSFSQEGAEEVTNGDFATDSDWTKGSGWTISGGKANASATTGQLYQATTTSVNTKYKIEYTISNYVSGSYNFLLRGTSTATFSGNGTFTVYITSGSGGNSNFIIDGVSSFTGSIDNVSVKEVLQDWSVKDYGAVNPSAVITPNTEGVKLEKTVSADWRSSFLVQPISYTSGSQYKVTFKLKNGNLPSGGGVYVRALYDSSSHSIVNNLTLTNDWVEYTYYYTADSNSLDISFGNVDWQNAGVGQYFYINDVSVKEVGQDWTLQPKWSIGNGFAQLISNDSTGGSLIPNTSITSGNKYKCSFDVVVNSGSCKLQGSSGTTYKVIDETKTYSFNLIADSGAIYFNRLSAISNITITNISVIEITDDTNLPRINYEGFSYQDSLGSEEVVNGDFATDTNWVKLNATISGGTGNLNATGVTSLLYQNILTNGKTYKATFTVSNYNGLGQALVIDNSGSGIYTITSNGTFTFTFTHSIANGNFLFRAINGAIFSVDNVSVKEYLGQEVVPDSGCGSWLLEPQSTNLFPYSEDFSNSSWS